MTDRIREIANVYAANVYEVDNLYNAIIALVFDEREACARLCDSLFRNTDEQDRIIKTIAAAIRARAP